MKPMASAALPSLAPSRIDQACDANGRQRSVTLPSQPSSSNFAISRHASPHGGFLFRAALRLFELSRVFVRFDYVASLVVSAT
jgi:hypothetical protein